MSVNTQESIREGTGSQVGGTDKQEKKKRKYKSKI